ncbi:tRNA (guanosine(37)-N1)-methyltransferase TrmD [Lysinibacillus sp. 2017]|uniref:tRNA (guanosine(37)-N1)-methyltransferase TrmD n=1 Tax=unclassified Lysinibacillus TaxID=2636778 RepID=UPI000D52890B|nr:MULTISPECIES: tRNA (guanosine(37)-N1)-methyltransferase TrmD [unclassified Lysinibacillus]AWE06653.1 tRNA (guanosine(37)-N1)-methyltransferase TrmD [Lysinibacillus sp. 2017]TGN37415.1 tRNA (guanosine(37)-N1)-methyltransferase TrmD [Lysinibacillus sp. S2017]
MQIHVLSLFPEMFSGVFGSSIIKKAQEKGAVELAVTDIREYSENKHKQVDDYPYGGGAGMVLKPEPMFKAVEAITKDRKPRVILMCPQGERFNQKKAEELSKEDDLVFLCGHYEGYDERIRTHLVTDEISIGDFVLTGGELPAMTIIDSIVRLLPGVLGQQDSHIQDSFSTGLLEHPHYTRPAEFRGMKVPDVLLSGNHAKIAEWREEQSFKRTLERRPDLIEALELTDKQLKIIAKIKSEM